MKRRGLTMNLEIHKPELAQRVQARIQSGLFHDADELIEKALRRSRRTDNRRRGSVGNRRGRAGGVTGPALSRYRSNPPARAPHQCAGCRALMAWLLETNIVSERRKPKPAPRVPGFFDCQPPNALVVILVRVA